MTCRAIRSVDTTLLVNIAPGAKTQTVNTRSGNHPSASGLYGVVVETLGEPSVRWTGSVTVTGVDDTADRIERAVVIEQFTATSAAPANR